jgi:hypothetical protein
MCATSRGRGCGLALAHGRLQPGCAATIDEAQAHAVLTRPHAVLTALAADANLDLNFDKCALLLPPGHAAASAPSCFTGMKVSARGTKVAGAPIGDDDFCAQFVQVKVQEANAKIRALEGIHPQVGMLLLRLVVPKLQQRWLRSVHEAIAHAEPRGEGVGPL